MTSPFTRGAKLASTYVLVSASPIAQLDGKMVDRPGIPEAMRIVDLA